MLSCDQALELISARLDGPLSQEETEELEEHLSACPACRALSDELELLHKELPTLAAQPPAGLKEGVMDQIRASKITPFQSKKSRWRWRSLASLAAVAVLALVAVGAVDQWREHGMLGSEQNVIAPAAAEVMTDQTGGEAGQAAPSSMPTEESQAEIASAPLPTQGPAAESESGQIGRSVVQAPQEETQESAAPQSTEGNGVSPYSNGALDDRSADSSQPTVNAFASAAATKSGLTQSQALLKLAAWLGWDTEGLTVDESGTVTGPIAADGTTSRLICAGLNETGTGWLCQLEQTTPGGADSAVSCITYTVPLDGGEITQP